MAAGRGNGVALIFAFGENTFVYPALRKIIPQLSFVTYPVKYVTLVAFLCRCSRLSRSHACKICQRPRKHEFPKAARLVGTILLGLLAGILFWAWRFPFPTDDVHATLLNGLLRAFFLLVTGGLLLLLTREPGPGLRRIAPLLLIVVAWLDVFTHEPPQNPTVPPSVYDTELAARDSEHGPTARTRRFARHGHDDGRKGLHPFRAQRSENNFLAKRAGYCANVNLLDAVPKVDGFFSLTPRESDDLISLFYSTTNAEFPRLEDFLGVSQITARTNFSTGNRARTFLPLVTAGQKPVFLDDANTLRALTQPDFDGSKMVFLPPEAKAFVTVTNQTAARVLKSHFGTQSVDIEVEAGAPSLVVVAQTWYHNWRADVDGKPARLLRANHAFQAIEIPEGRHRVQLIYRDRAFEIGAAVSICMVVNCFIFLAGESASSIRKFERNGSPSYKTGRHPI